MPSAFATSAAEIRKSVRAFNQQARQHPERAQKLLTYTTYWVYDPDTDLFGPSKFVGLAQMNFKDYEWQRMKLTGSQTRLAIERAVDDVFVSRPRWKGALRVWGEDLLGPTTLGKADTNRWKFTSLRARASVSIFSFDDESKAFPEGELQSEKVTRPREKRDRTSLNSWHPEMESRGMNSLRK